MRVLIAYDGSDCAAAALADLQYAGLPELAEVLVLSVGEITSQLPAVATLTAGPGYYFPDDPNVKALDDRQLHEVQASADLARDRLRAGFPGWDIEAEALVDMAEPAILRKAAEWKPDLIVVGSHGRSGFRRFFLGSVSEYIVKHAHCSVRISRLHSPEHASSLRLLVATDGSPDATAAVQSIALRRWPTDTQVRVMGVLDFRSWFLASAKQPPASMLAPVAAENIQSPVTEAVHRAVEHLTHSGLAAAAHVLVGTPAHVLVDEAERWNANCIFVGAKGPDTPRHFLGNVSTAVAVRAHCSVEVVRQPVDMS